MMHAATITIQYVNLPKPPNPGRKQGPGSIKDAGGTVYTVWGDLMESFLGREGQTVTINYKEDGEYMGLPRLTVLGIAGGSPKAPPRVPSPRSVIGGPAAAPPMETFAPPPPLVPITPARKDENIATLSVFSSTKWGEKLTVGDREALVHMLRVCRSAWRELQTGNISLTEEALDDELPSFRESESIEDTF